MGLAAFVTSAINEADIERAFGMDPLVEGPWPCAVSVGAPTAWAPPSSTRPAMCGAGEATAWKVQAAPRMPATVMPR
jgi:hypothetical protein